MTETLNNIPKKYHKPNIVTACKISGKYRSKIYKDHIDDNIKDESQRITKSTDSKGNTYIDLSELIRVFGFDTCTKNIKKLETGQDKKKDKEKRQQGTAKKAEGQQEQETPDVSEINALKLELLEAKKDLEFEKKLNKKLEDQISEEKDRVKTSELKERKTFELLERTQLLLEDSRRRYDDVREEKRAADTPPITTTPEPKKGFWSRLFGG